MLGGLLAATNDSTASDPLARWLATAGLVVAFLALVLNAYRAWRDRAHLKVELKADTVLDTMFAPTTTRPLPTGAGGLAYRDALVTVRNSGRRPTSVERISFEKVGASPEAPLSRLPVYLPLRAEANMAAPLREFGINVEQPPVTLGEHDIRTWRYRLLGTEEPWTDTVPPPITNCRAVVWRTKGKPIRSNAVGFWLRPSICRYVEAPDDE
ncbi:MAG: hypothetical protein ACRD07_04675 [Acidimicrobiales bacterium]